MSRAVREAFEQIERGKFYNIDKNVGLLIRIMISLDKNFIFINW